MPTAFPCSTLYELVAAPRPHAWLARVAIYRFGNKSIISLGFATTGAGSRLTAPSSAARNCTVPQHMTRTMRCPVLKVNAPVLVPYHAVI